MTDPTNHDDPRRSPLGVDDERRVAAAPEITPDPEPAPGEETSAVRDVAGLQLGVWLPVVIVGAVFLIAIIAFAVTR
jgi:hypothetical protein